MRDQLSGFSCQAKVAVGGNRGDEGLEGGLHKNKRRRGEKHDVVDKSTQVHLCDYV